MKNFSISIILAIIIGFIEYMIAIYVGSLSNPYASNQTIIFSLFLIFVMISFWGCFILLELKNFKNNK